VRSIAYDSVSHQPVLIATYLMRAHLAGAKGPMMSSNQAAMSLKK